MLAFDEMHDRRRGLAMPANPRRAAPMLAAIVVTDLAGGTDDDKVSGPARYCALAHHAVRVVAERP